MSIRIVPLIEGHWPEVSAIYTEGIATGHATFESEPPDWAHFDASRLPDHRHVAVENGHVFGWVAASPCPTGARTPGSSRTRSTLLRRSGDKASDSSCSVP